MAPDPKTRSVVVRSKDGTTSTESGSSLSTAYEMGARTASNEEAHKQKLADWADDNQLLAGLAGAGRGALPFFDQAAVALGGSPEKLKALRDKNPITSGLFEIMGMGGSLAAGPLAAVGKAGTVLGAKTAAKLGGGALGKAVGGAAGVGLETGVLGLQHEISNLALNRPTSAGDAATRLSKGYLGGWVMGAGLGLAGSGLIAPLLGKAATKARKYRQSIEAAEAEIGPLRQQLKHLEKMQRDVAKAPTKSAAKSTASAELIARAKRLEGIKAAAEGVQKRLAAKEALLGVTRGGKKRQQDSMVSRIGEHTVGHMVKRAVASMLGGALGGTGGAVAAAALYPAARAIFKNAGKAARRDVVKSRVAFARGVETGVRGARKAGRRAAPAAAAGMSWSNDQIDEALRNKDSIDPQAVYDSVLASAQNHMAPDDAEALAANNANLSQLLLDQLPSPPKGLRVDGPWRPSHSERQRARELLAASLVPAKAVERFWFGNPTKADISVMRALDPQSVRELSIELERYADEKVRSGERLAAGQAKLVELLTDKKKTRPLHNPRTVAMIQQMYKVEEQQKAAARPSRAQPKISAAYVTRIERALLGEL